MLEQNIAQLPLVADVDTPQVDREAVSRVFDLIVASAALVFVAPLLLLTALIIAGRRKGPVVFAHERIGRGGRTFRVYKFRTMVVNADRVLSEHLDRDPGARAEWEATYKLRRDPRITVTGSFLRSSSIDELPQLFNVLRGEMSLVGPRPIVVGEIAKYGAHFGAYCSVRPGITGMWQVSGRNDVAYERRVEFDAAYARRKSISLDLGILAATVPAVLTRRGSY